MAINRAKRRSSGTSRDFSSLAFVIIQGYLARTFNLLIYICIGAVRRLSDDVARHRTDQYFRNGFLQQEASWLRIVLAIRWHGITGPLYRDQPLGDDLRPFQLFFSVARSRYVLRWPLACVPRAMLQGSGIHRHIGTSLPLTSLGKCIGLAWSGG